MAAYDPVWSIAVAEGEPPLVFVGRESGSFAKYSATKLDLGATLELKGHTKAVTGIALASGDEAFTASMDGSIRQWAIAAEVEGKRDTKTVTVGSPLRCLLQVGETLLAGSTKGWIYAVPVATPGDGSKGAYTNEAQVPRWKGHSDAVVCLAQSDGVVCSGSYDNQARVWDTAGRCLFVLAGHSNGIKSVQIISSQYILTASRDETVRLWAIPEGAGGGEGEPPKAGDEEAGGAAGGTAATASKSVVIRPLAQVAIPASPHAAAAAGAWVYIGSTAKQIYGINTKDFVRSVQDFYAENAKLYNTERSKTLKNVASSVAEVNKKTKRAIRKYKKSLADEEKKAAQAARQAAKRGGRVGPADDDDEPAEEAAAPEDDAEAGDGEEAQVTLSAERQELLSKYSAEQNELAEKKIAGYKTAGDSRIAQLEPISKLKFEYGKEKFYAASFTRAFPGGDEAVVALATLAKTVYYSNGPLVATATLIPGVTNL